MIRVTVYNEFHHEKTRDDIKAIYPEGMHKVISDFLSEEEDITVRCFTLENVEQITDEVLNDTDVMLWWGHVCHKEVPDEVAQRVQKAVLSGMGMIFLHSAHHSKPFKLLMGTTCNLSWREDGDWERIWVIDQSHPIAQGIDRCFKLPHEETYAEPFNIPEPEKLVFIGCYEGGEVFRSGCCYKRENGNIFYFQPGHEQFPTFKDKNVQRIIKNAVRWAAPIGRYVLDCPHVKKLTD